jgi:hypothetical protein
VTGLKTQATAIAAAAAAVTLGLLQLLQQTISAFSPRPVISAAIVVAAFFASLTAAHFRTRSNEQASRSARAEQLREIFAVHPLTRMSDAEGVSLGVFPPRRSLPSPPPYVRRSIDEELRAAMAPGAMLLVVGEPRAGTSRTVHEAARTALADAFVVAPRSPHALSELLTLTPGLQLPAGSHTVVWLDDLDRYDAVLDAESLDALTQLAGRVTIIATIRTGEWDTWMSATGATAAAARAVVSRARIFMLAGQLDADELAHAHQLYPTADLAAGIGSAVAATGRENAPPALHVPLPAGSDEPAAASARRDPLVVLPALGTLAALICLLLVWTQSGFSTPSVSDQLAAIERAGSTGGRVARVLAVADLRGTGENSYVLEFADPPDVRKPPSDDVRIYDQVGNSLVQAFRFEPSVPAGAQFNLRAVADVDGSGGDQVVAGFGYRSAVEADGAMVPFAIYWDGSADRYRIKVLDMGAPDLSGPPANGADRQYRALYAQPATFADPADHVTLTGHLVQDFAVTAPPYRLVAGWFLRIGSSWCAQCHRAPLKATFQLAIAIFGVGGAPYLTPCTLTGETSPLTVQADRSLQLMHVFNNAYAAAIISHSCTPDNLP